MRISNYEFNIVVAGRPITEYVSQNNIFVEGRKGSEFNLEFKNNTYQRVLVVPSVDGKSVLDGKVATKDSRGFIVNAHSKLEIPGWMLDGNSAAKFVFESKDRSYASQTASSGEIIQTGVVGVVVFAEVVEPSYTKSAFPINAVPYAAMRGGAGNTVTHNSTSAGDPTMPWFSTCNNMSVGSVASVPTGASLSATSNVVHDSFNMGTGFGQKTDFKTKESVFNKAAELATMLIYYDSRKNLERRGIEVVKKETRYLSDLPQAFSGGCTPPPGWQG